jgi:hypothetical protein
MGAQKAQTRTKKKQRKKTKKSFLHRFSYFIFASDLSSCASTPYLLTPNYTAN